jgi:myo-inositol-hexaphosphate 3-phosphohydrolase
MLRDTTEIKQEVKPKIKAFKGDSKEGIKSKLEDDKVMTSAQAERRQTKYESDGKDRKVGDFLIRQHQDIKDERQNKSDRGDISLFVVKPGFWDGLRIPEQGSNDDDGAVSEASSKGESLISASDFEPEDEFNFRE